MNATAEPSGEIAGDPRSAVGSSAIVVRSPVATSTSTNVWRSEAFGTGHRPGRHGEPAVRADVDSSLAKALPGMGREIPRG